FVYRMLRQHQRSPLSPYTTLFRSRSFQRALVAELIGTFALVFGGAGAIMVDAKTHALGHVGVAISFGLVIMVIATPTWPSAWVLDRKSTRLNSSHVAISYAVFCLE